jgi:hypothetical protein
MVEPQNSYLYIEDSNLIDKIVSNITKDASFSFTKNSL